MTDATPHTYRRIIVWFRRALRVDDNMALRNALDDAESIVPLLSLSEAPAYRERTERHFMDHLTDADLASNNGGWQWTAGTGTDASPWFRIFNPVLQAKKFDPDGAYVRRYGPELRSTPTHAICEPSTMDRQEQEAAGCILDRSYPPRS
jgi:deoxyribodipyrimidine photolyase